MPGGRSSKSLSVKNREAAVLVGTTLRSPQTGTPPLVSLISWIGLPSLSKTCQARSPSLPARALCPCQKSLALLVDCHGGMLAFAVSARALDLFTHCRARQTQSRLFPSSPQAQRFLSASRRMPRTHGTRSRAATCRPPHFESLAGVFGASRIMSRCVPLVAAR